MVAIIAVITGILYYNARKSEFEEEVAYNLGEEGVQIFKAFDRDDDNYLSVLEFEPLYHSLIKRNGESAKVRNIDCIQKLAD